MSLTKISFLPVDNGNMTFIKLNDAKKTTVLYDMYIREKSKDKNDESYDVLKYLKNNLERDDKGRPFVDVFILSHHDDDHIKGFENEFHIGDIKDYKEDSEKIYIKEIWGSARFLKRASKFHTLESDARAFNKEMNRRFNQYKNNNKKIQAEGNRIRILGSCPDGGTDDAEDIVYEMESTIKKFNERDLSSKIKANLLGPLEQQKGEDDKVFKEKNRGSVILQLEITQDKYTHKVLLTGDAEENVCNMLNDCDSSFLEYDILLSPHHCSKYSIYKKINKEESELSSNALAALSHNKKGAKIIASCREFGKDTPPHKEAKKEYEKIVGAKNFEYTAANKIKGKVRPIVLELTKEGHKRAIVKSVALGLESGEATGAPRGHG